MSDILLYFGLAAVGYVLAFKWFKGKSLGKIIGNIQMIAIFLLVIIMGFRIGSNREVIDNLGSLGLYAFSITILTIVFSVICLAIGRRLMKMDAHAHVTKGGEDFKAVQSTPEGESSNKMAYTIILSVAIGMVAGYFATDFIEKNLDTFNTVTGLIIKVGLCIILFFVGFDMGTEGTFFKDVKAAGYRVIMVPILIAFGSLAGALIFGLISPFPMNESLAVGAGFSWYTLASAMILEKGFVMAAAVSFMHNVMRELFSIIFVPFVAKKIGYIECLGLPACCSSDVALPVIARSTNNIMVVYSFVNGLVLALMVPWFVNLFL